MSDSLQKVNAVRVYFRLTSVSCLRPRCVEAGGSSRVSIFGVYIRRCMPDVRQSLVRAEYE